MLQIENRALGAVHLLRNMKGVVGVSQYITVLRGGSESYTALYSGHKY